MAKKKSVRANEKQTEQDLPQQLPPSAMEDSESKISKLKSLNDLLLKETMERRKEVSGLIESNKLLEGELSRSSSDLEGVRLELVMVRDSQAENEVSKDVVSAFVESKVRDEVERLREINERLVRDIREVEAAKAEEVKVLRKELEAGIGKYSLQAEESNILREKLRVTEVEGRIKEEATKEELEGLVRVRNEMGKEIVAMKRDIEDKSMALEESSVRIGALEREIEAVGRDKSGAEKERGELNVRVGELVKEVKVLNGIVLALRKSEKEQRDRFVELETSYGEGLDKEKDLKGELSTLFEESKKKDCVIGELMEEKLKAVEESRVRIETLEREIEAVRREKLGAEEEKEDLNVRVVKLAKEVNILNGIVVALRKREKEQGQRFVELESSYGEGLEKEKDLKRELSTLLEGSKKNDSVIGELMEEKLKAVEQSRVQIVALEREIEAVGRENLGVVKERGDLNVRVGELVKEVKVLNGIVVALRKSEKEQRDKFVELESSCGEGLEKEKELKRELSTLFEESKKKDSVIGELTEEKLKAIERLNGLEKELETAEEVKGCLLLEKDGVVKEKNQLGNEIVKLTEEVSNFRNKIAEREESCTNESVKNKQLSNEIDDFKREIDRVSFERDEVCKVLEEEKMRAFERLAVLEKELGATEEVKQSLMLEKGVVVNKKNQLESDIVKFVEQVSMLRVKIAESEVLCSNQTEKNKQLSSEIDSYMKEFDRVSVERDEVGKALALEKMNGKKLNLKLKELSKKMEDGAKEMERLKGANDDLVEKKKGLEVNVKKLVSEKGLLEKKLLECKKQIGVLEDSVRIKNETLEQALTKLKNGAEKLSKATVEMVGVGSIQIKERDLNGDIEPYMDELESIRAAFANKETEVKVMKQQVDSLQVSVVDAQKKKSFWTLVSSATTILAAAVSLAYASKLR